MNPKLLVGVAFMVMITGCATPKVARPISGLVAKDGPVQFDTPDTHVIVLRALDSWSGDDGASEDSLTAVQKHKGGFRLASEKGPRYDVPGFPLGLGFNSDSTNSQVVQGVVAALKPLHFTLAQSTVNFIVERPVVLEPEMLGEFIKYQRDLYRKLVIAEGNPATLHNSVGAKKFFANVLSVGTVVLGAEKYGSLGANALLMSGIPGDVYHAVSAGRAALAPLDLPDFDTAGYKSIEVRRIVQGSNDRVGQIIIAYKKDKTESAENAALITAIVTLTGADTTVDSIQLARDADLAKRQAIWDACVADGKCK
jgi:hypothetical protein